MLTFTYFCNLFAWRSKLSYEVMMKRFATLLTVAFLLIVGCENVRVNPANFKYLKRFIFINN